MTPGKETDRTQKEVGNVASWSTVGHGKDKEVRAEGGPTQRSLSLPCLLRQVGRGGCSRSIQIEDAPAFCTEPHSTWKLRYSVGEGIG